MNKITTEAHHLLMLHVLRLLGSSRPIPILGKNYLKKFFIAVTSKEEGKGGKPIKPDPEIEETKHRLYLPLCKEELASRELLNHCMSYAAQDMAVAVKNNIVLHFFRRQYRYLHEKNPDLKKKEVWELQQRINSVVPPNHETLPSTVSEKGLAYDLKAHPERFLPFLYTMNQFLESRERKTFSLLPLRRGFVPKAVHIDTEVLFNWTGNMEESKDFRVIFNSERKIAPPLAENRKRKRRSKQEKIDRCDVLWNPFFRLGKIRPKSFSFGYHIMTNGYEVSILRKGESKKNDERDENAEDKEENDAEKWRKRRHEWIGRPIVGLDPGDHTLMCMTTDSTEKESKICYTAAQRRFESGTKEDRRWRKRLNKLNPEIQTLKDRITKTNSRTCDMTIEDCKGCCNICKTDKYPLFHTIPRRQGKYWCADCLDKKLEKRKKNLSF